MIKGVLLDFDGTVVETEFIRFRAINQVIGTFEREIPYSDWERYYKNYDTLTILNMLLSDTSKNKQRLEEVHNIRKELEQKEGLPVKNGFFHWYYQLKQDGVKVIICSGGRREHILYAMQIANLPSLPIIAKEDYSSRKPSPEVYLKGLELLSLAKEEVVVVDDSYTGLLAAKNAHLPFIYMGNHTFSFIASLSPLTCVKDFEDLENKGFR